MILYKLYFPTNFPFFCLWGASLFRESKKKNKTRKSRKKELFRAIGKSVFPTKRGHILKERQKCNDIIDNILP